MITRIFGKTRCGDILAERIKTDVHPLVRKKIVTFIRKTFEDFKALRAAPMNKNQFDRIRQIYLTGRFQQLDGIRKKHHLSEDIVQRIQYVIRFQTRFMPVNPFEGVPVS